MNNKNRPGKKRDDSYIAISRRKRNRYLKIIGIPIAVAIVVLAIVIATQAQEHGLGAKIVYHIHPFLNVTNNGKHLTVPKGIGINSSLYKDHSLDKYSTPEIAPIHTHDSSGTIHVESTVNRNFTLGELLNIWGINLDGKAVKVTVDGKPLTQTDFRSHVLRDKERISFDIKSM